jgi:hypothetical protein
LKNLSFKPTRVAILTSCSATALMHESARKFLRPGRFRN